MLPDSEQFSADPTPQKTEGGGDGAPGAIILSDGLTSDISAPKDLTHPALEGVVAEKLGVSRKRLAGLRKKCALVKGDHWDFDGGQIVYSRAGIDLAEKIVAGKVDPAVSTVIKKNRAALECLIVVGFPVNPRLLYAERKNGERVRVRVRISRPFVLGMHIDCREVEDAFYAYEGPMPRWPRDPRFFPRNHFNQGK